MPPKYQGMSVSRGQEQVFITHQMPDVEEMCEHVLLINEGKALL
jgi:ABC-type uncharacterized transport system ATPase subunit